MPDQKDTVQAFIRKAIIADIPRLQEIRAAVRENVLNDPSKVTLQDYLWFIEHGPLWVFEKDGNILGTSAGDPRDGTIWALFVDPAYEGHGIGRKLFDYACQSLKDAGHQTISLYTEAGSRAEKFYRAAGWVSDRVDKDGDIIFRKTLPHPCEPK